MMKHRNEPSQRQMRVGEEVRHTLAALLQRGELRDPIFGNVMIAVSEVRMSPDLKLATCFVSIVETTKSGLSADARSSGKEAVIAALNRHSPYIRGKMSVALRRLRYMPSFRFRMDSAFDNFSKIDSLLRSPEVARDLRKTDDKE